jgi:hypothetical protein
VSTDDNLAVPNCGKRHDLILIGEKVGKAIGFPRDSAFLVLSFSQRLTKGNLWTEAAVINNRLLSASTPLRKKRICKSNAS